MFCRFSLIALIALLVSFDPHADAQDIQKLKQLGVLNVVEPSIHPDETFTEIRAISGLKTAPFQPNTLSESETLHAQASGVIFRRDIWGFEFSYKPLRTMEIDVPQATGKMQRKVIWYLVYRVRNPGGHFSPQEEKDSFGHSIYNVVRKDYADPATLGDRFIPNFVLQGWIEDFADNVYVKKTYLDRVIPSIVETIRLEENIQAPLLNSVEMAQTKLPVSKNPDDPGTWGVALWEDIDPRIDYVTVLVQGLTNAFRVDDLPDGKTTYQHKTLQLNFWRPGDTLDETSDMIRVGIPVVESLREQEKICKHYELPGEIIIASEFSPNTDRQNELFRVDGQPDEDLNSIVKQILVAGQMPKSVKQGFEDLGVSLPDGIRLTETIKNRQWEFKLNVDGKDRYFRLTARGEFWEKVGGHLNIKDRLEYLWVYR